MRRLSPQSSPLGAWQRWLRVLLLALLALSLGAPVSAQTAARAGPAELGQSESLAPPGDSPRLEGSGLKMPAAPTSFNVHDGGWIRFAYEPSVRERVQPLITQANEARADLTRRFGRPVLDRVTVYVARTPGEMAALAPEGAPVPKYAAGVAYGDLGLVLLTIQPLDPNSHHDLGEVFRHELAHVAVHDAVEGRPVPRWFNEGFAVFASGESSFTRVQTLWTATLSEDLLPLKRMERSFPADSMGVSVAYAQAADVVRFLLRREDQARFTSMMERIRAGQTFESALRDAYNLDMATLEYEWREDVARRYTFWPVLFSGSLIWVGAIGLFVWGWRRRKRRDQQTLQRWEHEEAAEDAIQRRLREAAAAGARVHIVLAPRSDARALAELSQSVSAQPPPLPDGDVPKVEHDGRWHTVH